MAVKISTVDYIVFAAFLIASFAIGSFVSCKGKSNEINYILGDRKMKAIPIAMSLFASSWSAVSILGYPSEAYAYGAQFWMMCVANIVPSIFTAYLFIPKFRKLNIVSLYEYLELRFHKYVRNAASFCFILQTLLYMSVAIYAPSIAIELVTGLNIWISVVLVTAVSIVYSSIGGVRGVVWSDVLQFIIIIVGMFTTLIIGLVKIGGFQVMAEDFRKSNRTEFFVFEFDPRVRHTFFTLFFGSFGATIGALCFNQVNVQRFLCLEHDRSVKIVVALNLLGMWISVSLCLLLGMVIYSYYSDCDPLLNGTISQYTQIYPLFVADTLRGLPGLSGLFLATICSGTMSTVSSCLNSLSSVIFSDFISPWIGENSKFKGKLLVLRGLTIVLGIISLLLVTVVRKVGFILQAALMIVGVYSGPVTGLFFLGFFVAFVKWKAALFGFITSMAFQTWLLAGSVVHIAVTSTKPMNTLKCTNNATKAWTALEGPTSIGGIKGFYAISYLWHSITGILSCMLASIIISILIGDFMKKTPINDDLLIKFRPFKKAEKPVNTVELKANGADKSKYVPCASKENVCGKGIALEEIRAE